MLVEPDGYRRMQSQDEVLGDSAFGLGERPGAGVVDSVSRPPVPGEVAVQVDAVRVASGPARCAVRVQVRDDPQVSLCGRCEPEQALCDPSPGAFVSVHTAEDQHFSSAGWITGFDRDDRASFDRTAEKNYAATQHGLRGMRRARDSTAARERRDRGRNEYRGSG